MTEESARRYLSEHGKNVCRTVTSLHDAKSDLFSAIYWLSHVTHTDAESIIGDLWLEYVDFAATADLNESR